MRVFGNSVHKKKKKKKKHAFSFLSKNRPVDFRMSYAYLFTGKLSEFENIGFGTKPSCTFKLHADFGTWRNEPGVKCIF